MKVKEKDIAKFQETLFWSIENAEQLNDDKTSKELKKLSNFLDKLLIEGRI